MEKEIFVAVTEKEFGDKARNAPIESQVRLELKKYRVKISMVHPYEIVDSWVKKPDIRNALEVFIEELFTQNSDKYFEIEVNET
ncbi:MAG: hypothetical protein ACUVUE_05920 [Candidatus Bathycorpusculaceae bacterium]